MRDRLSVYSRIGDTIAFANLEARLATQDHADPDQP